MKKKEIIKLLIAAVQYSTDVYVFDDDSCGRGCCKRTSDLIDPLEMINYLENQLAEVNEKDKE